MTLFSRDRCTLVAEIGINHNGDLDMALEMVRRAHASGCDAVKFQKRTVDVVYSAAELAMPRASVFGTTNGDLKRGLEFGRDAYRRIDALCRDLGLPWFASAWDEASVDFLVEMGTPYLKLASASVTDRDLLVHAARTGLPLLVSTGMCDLSMVRQVVDTIEAAGGSIACLYHCTATYPAEPEEINLRGIETLARAFPAIPIGYSGHETGLVPSIAAAAHGAASIERHLTLDRTLWGSDQAASLEPAGMAELVAAVRLYERCRGDGEIRIYERERATEKKLRRKSTLGGG